MVLMSFLIIGVALIFLGQNFIISSHRDDMKSNAEIVSGYIKTWTPTTIRTGRRG